MLCWRSVVAVCDGEGRPYIIKDEDDSMTPSYVRYSEGGQCEVGQLAYKERYTDPLNTVCRSARLAPVLRGHPACRYYPSCSQTAPPDLAVVGEAVTGQSLPAA